MSASLVVPWAVDFAYRKLYSSSDADPELHKVATEDGIEVALWEYSPKNNRGDPILFVHGLGANHRNMALNEENGLVQFLSEHGYSCWAIDLRGRGESDTPSGTWNFDDYAKYDLPATIDYILEQTGRKRLHWIGHSMGGMLFYAVAGALGQQKKIASATTLASPFGMQEPLMVNRLALSMNQIFRKLGTVPLPESLKGKLRKLPKKFQNANVPLHQLPQSYMARWIGFIIIFFKRWLPQDFILSYMNPHQVDDATIRKGVNEVVERVSFGELNQFADWLLNDRWTDLEGTVDYAKGVSDLEVPILMIGGAEDRMTPAHHLKWGFNAMKAEDKKFVLAGEDSGFENDYAHVDLVLGNRARDEIFPIILDWIKKHPS
jgi:pimeloyl-ACP methyl ester carboxylesterase